MTLWGTGGAWGNLEHEHVAEIAAALEVHRSTPHAEPRPLCGFHLEEIDSIIFDDRYRLGVYPIQIWIDAVAYSVQPVTFTHNPPHRIHENNSDLITTGTTPGGSQSSPTSTKSSSCRCT